jgi:hypothetical protein
MLTYLVVPSTLGESSHQRIYVRDFHEPLGLFDYRNNPELWREAGHALAGRVVALDASQLVRDAFWDCQPFNAPLVVVDGQSWAVEVQTDSTGKWYGNAVRYPNKDDAERAAADLASRWTLVHAHRAAPSLDVPNRAPSSVPA